MENSSSAKYSSGQRKHHSPENYKSNPRVHNDLLCLSLSLPASNILMFNSWYNQVLTKHLVKEKECNLNRTKSQFKILVTIDQSNKHHSSQQLENQLTAKEILYIF